MKQKCSSLLSLNEIVSIFSNSHLYEQKSFHYLDKKDTTYNTNRFKENFLDESRTLYNKFKDGHTIIVKNLEMFNKNIRLKAASLGPYTDVHMYLVPPNGGHSFPYHQDTRDVLVHLIYGKKTFFIKTQDQEIKNELIPGDELFLPKENQHMAIPSGASCLLSFGIVDNLSYAIPTNFKECDFCNDQEVL